MVATPLGTGHEDLPFADVLRTCRLRTGLTQAQLARRSNLGVRTIRDLELGRTLRPHRDSVELLATSLGLSGESREAFARAATHRVTTLSTAAEVASATVHMAQRALHLLHVAMACYRRAEIALRDADDRVAESEMHREMTAVAHALGQTTQLIISASGSAALHSDDLRIGADA
jgi:transcriptional regulator with XRE-family HTH domain